MGNYWENAEHLRGIQLHSMCFRNETIMLLRFKFEELSKNKTNHYEP